MHIVLLAVSHLHTTTHNESPDLDGWSSWILMLLSLAVLMQLRSFLNSKS